jgi:hypothetical protein
VNLMMRLKVYGDRSHYALAERKALNDLLKSLWNTQSPAQRRETYGAHVELFESVDDPAAADVHLLPMKWPHYVDSQRVAQAVQAIEVARRVHRPIAVFSGGDFAANLPIEGKDIHVFESAGYRSRTTVTRHGMPPFIDDPVFGAITVRERPGRALVGFCGQAGATPLHHAARLVRNRIARVRWRLGRERWEPPPFEHTWFRQRVLDVFANSSAVDTRFVVRTKYRAGERADTRNDPADRARREFLDNLTGTDYTICMRGGGNFSLRFYESLAAGRTPVFVDTDCQLPFAGQIDWKQHVVWIDAADLPHAPAILAEHHAARSADEHRERQHINRKLWEDWLTAPGFYSRFRSHFPELAR